MGKKFNWGIIGTGGIANAFANDLNDLDNHQVKAVLSRKKKKAIEFSLKYKKCVPYHSYEYFLTNSSVDGVYVATPNHLHLKHTLLALNAGLPVLCEKPFALNSKEVKLMIDTANSKKLLLVEAMWSRFLPHMIEIKNIVNNGELGEILTIQADHGQNLRNIKNPRLWNTQYGGGSLLDLGIYVISFAHLILGNPEEIKANSYLNNKGIDLQTSIILKYENGAQAILNTTMINNTPCRAVISGEYGRIEIDPIFYAPSSFKVILNNGKTIYYPNKYKGHGLREQAVDFVKCVEKNLVQTSIMSHLDSLQVMQTMDKIRKEIGLSFPNE